MTLNMLRTCRQDPTISAYKSLNGPFDYNKTPLAPLGFPAVIYNNPTTSIDGNYRVITLFSP